jgi:hypothetical protein
MSNNKITIIPHVRLSDFKDAYPVKSPGVFAVFVKDKDSIDELGEHSEEIKDILPDNNIFFLYYTDNLSKCTINELIKSNFIYSSGIVFRVGVMLRKNGVKIIGERTLKYKDTIFIQNWFKRNTYVKFYEMESLSRARILYKRLSFLNVPPLNLIDL